MTQPGTPESSMAMNEAIKVLSGIFNPAPGNRTTGIVLVTFPLTEQAKELACNVISNGGDPVQVANVLCDVADSLINSVIIVPPVQEH